jgi:hypothetical protein
MSITSYIQKEQLIKKLEGDLVALKEKPEIQKDLEFKEKLEALMKDYGVSQAFVLKVVTPEAYSEENKPKKARKPRKLKVFTNPHTGEVIETRGGNHRVIKAWKKEFGSEEVESWVTEPEKEASSQEASKVEEQPKQEAKKEEEKPEKEKPVAVKVDPPAQKKASTKQNKPSAKRDLPAGMKPMPKGHKPKFQFTPKAKH